MGYFFLDIETYIDETNPATGLNPYLERSKIIAIAYNYYPQFILTEKDIHPPSILKEWTTPEKGILSSFYDFIKSKVETDEHLKLVGFNLIKFDLPYLFGRLVADGVVKSDQAHDTLFARPHHIDLAQLAMVTSQRMKQRKEFYNVSNNELRSFFGLAKKEGKGTDVSVFYRRRDYDKILDYITSEFNLEILYILLRRHIHAKGTMDQ